MLVKEAIKILDAKVLSEGDLNKEITYGLVCDLLSDVMGKGEEGVLWLTVQGHVNIVAVAVLIEASAVVVCDGMSIDEETVNKAKEKGVCILATDLPSFEAAGRLYEAGLRGVK